MITVILMILEKKFGKDFGDATIYTPILDLVGAILTVYFCCDCG